MSFHIFRPDFSPAVQTEYFGSMDFWVSDKVLSVVMPPMLYWICCGLYVLVAPAEKNRLFSMDEEETANLVTKREAIRRAFLNQAIMTVILVLLTFVGEDTSSVEATSFFVTGRQLLAAVVVQDAWHYWAHRFLHTNKFLYKHIHEQHHRLVVPYAFGTLYTHPLEGLLVDTLGTAASVLLSGMSLPTSTIFFALTFVKAIDDHSGLWFPNHPFHRLLSNNSAFHAVHHQRYGSKYNYSSQFFTVWDRLMETYLPYAVQEAKGGGYEIRTPKN